MAGDGWRGQLCFQQIGISVENSAVNELAMAKK